MALQFYTQRQFAALAGVSPATISRMVSDGRIRIASNINKIPSSELLVFLNKNLKKYSKSNTLYFTAGDADFEQTKNQIIARLGQKFGSNLPRFITSLEDLYSQISAEDSDRRGNLSDSEVQLIESKYKERVLKEFINLYQGTVESCLNSIFTKEDLFDKAKALSLGVLKDLLYYGKAVSQDSNDNFFENLNEDMDEKFTSIMFDLALVDDENELLFTREALTPEFFKGEGELYNHLTSKEVHFSDGTELTSALMQQVASKYEKGLTTSIVGNLIGKGLYMVVNLSKDMSEEEQTKVCNALLSGVFGNIYVPHINPLSNVAPDRVLDKINDIVNTRSAKFNFYN